MREFNECIFEAQELMIRIKSNNYDCYVDKHTYDDITIGMSSVDLGTHKAVLVYIGTHRLDEIKSIVYDIDRNMYWFQDNKGDHYPEKNL